MRNICLYFGTPHQNNQKLSFDEIVKKYGVRVWNGDKVFLQVIEETETNFNGYAHGVGETGEIIVSIEKSDVVSISEAGSDSWQDI